MGILSAIGFLWNQLKQLPLPSGGDVPSRVFMVVGSNVGLGLEASVHIACMKPKSLLVTCRDTDKCKRTQQVILERASADGEESQQVETCPLDLSKFDSVRAVADYMAAKEDRQLNVVVANAAVLRQDYSSTLDGWNLTLQVNYISTVLLSILLLPYLAESSTPDSPSRLVFVSSLAHYFGGRLLKDAGTWDRILETVSDEKFANEEGRYSVSKLFGVMFLRELEARLPKPSPVVVCSVDPGLCRTDMFWNSQARFMSLFSRSAEQGSRTLLHGAIGGDADVINGRYLATCSVSRESEYVFTPEGQELSKKLWDETISLLSQIDPRVPQIIEQYLRND
ncbi:hypothetical protein V8B97DRAFT_814267 [Scleroderma yunnanense]